MKNLSVIFVAVAFILVNFVNAFAEDVKVDGKTYHLEKMISHYSTTFNAKKQNRTANIKRAVASIHGLFIKPNEVVSFNKIVGPRTAEAGFYEAASFAGGKVVKSIGGGICQVASTWSAATIKSNLSIIERHVHSMPVSYITPDKEATVAYGTKDFKFKNTSKDILFVKCFVRQNVLHVEFWKCTDAKPNTGLKASKKANKRA